LVLQKTSEKLKQMDFKKEITVSKIESFHISYEILVLLLGSSSMDFGKEVLYNFLVKWLQCFKHGRTNLSIVYEEQKQ